MYITTNTRPPINPVPNAEAPNVKAAKSLKNASQKLEQRCVVVV